MKSAVITLQAAYRGHQQRIILAQQHLAATKLQATFKKFVARKRYLMVNQAVRVLQKRFRAHQLSQKVRRDYHIKIGALVTLQAAVRGLVLRRALQRKHKQATLVQAHVKGYLQRVRYQKIRKATLVLQRRIQAYQLGRKMHEDYRLKKASATAIQAFYRCHREKKSFAIKKQSVMKIQAVVRGCLERIHAKKFKEERTVAAIAFQRRWRANALRDQQVRMYNIQRGAVITIQATARTYLVKKAIKKQHRAATCIQSSYRCHQAVQYYKKTLSAIQVLQDRLRAHLLAKQVLEEYNKLKSAALTVQSVYRGLRVRRRVALEHVAATQVQALVRQSIARRNYMRLKWAAVVLQRGFRAQVACREERVRYHLTRGAIITLQAAVRRLLARRELKRLHKAAITLQSAYRSRKQQQAYKHTREAIILLQRRVRACQKGRKLHRDYNKMKSAAVVLQSVYRGVVARRLAVRHRAARSIQSMYRMHVERSVYVKQRSSVIQVQAYFRMYLAKKSHQKLLLAVRTLQSYTRGYLEMKKTRGDFLKMQSAAIVVQSHFRRHAEEQRYQKHRQATICIQTHFRRRVQQKQYRQMREATLVLQKRYRAYCLTRQTMEAYHLTRCAIITLQAVIRGYLQCSRYRHLRYHIIKLQARVRGAMTRRRYAQMIQERRAALCIQRHYRGYQTRKALEAKRQARLAELQLFVDRAKAHLSIIRLQRAYRNFQLRRMFKQRMDAIITVQNWMRAKLQRLRYVKLRQSARILQRAARRYLAKKNAAATRLQSVARVWLARRYVQKMQSGALKLQALWRGHRIRCGTKSKKVRQARARCQRANQNATEEKKLCNRTASALDYLLHYKSMARILETLISLEVVSRLSALCCQRLVEGGAVPVLYALVRGCNRSVPCMEIIHYITNILLNLTKNESTQHAVLDDEEAVTTLIDLLQIYREKNHVIFCKTCVILGRLLQDTAQARIILAIPKTAEKIASLHKLTSRKHTMDERRFKNKSLNASAFNTSAFLGGSMNVSSAAASFAAGTPRKQRRIRALAGAEWNIEDPMRAIDFLKSMVERA